MIKGEKVRIEEILLQRHSVRNYNYHPIDDKVVMDIIQYGITAPSGRNKQPWRFVIIKERDKIAAISDISMYNKWMKEAAVLIFILLNDRISYDIIKDMQSCGAVMQNILLYYTSLGYGTCWIGEFTNSNKADVRKIIGINNKEEYTIAGLIVVGTEKEKKMSSKLKNPEEFIFTNE